MYTRCVTLSSNHQNLFAIEMLKRDFFSRSFLLLRQFRTVNEWMQCAIPLWKTWNICKHAEKHVVKCVSIHAFSKIPRFYHICHTFVFGSRCFFLRHWTIPFSFYANANDPMRRVNWMRWRKDLQNKIELVSACVLSIGHSIAGLLLAIHIDSHKPLVFFFASWVD